MDRWSWIASKESTHLVSQYEAQGSVTWAKKWTGIERLKGDVLAASQHAPNFFNNRRAAWSSLASSWHSAVWQESWRSVSLQSTGLRLQVLIDHRPQSSVTIYHILPPNFGKLYNNQRGCLMVPWFIWTHCGTVAVLALQFRFGPWHCWCLSVSDQVSNGTTPQARSFMPGSKGWRHNA